MIWCIGESLYDIVFSDGQPRWAVPGGSMLNVAVSAARFGNKVSLISETGSDTVGSLITDFLDSNGISTEFLKRYNGNTTLALAFLNEAGDATYQFYHHSPEQAPDFPIPQFSAGDVFVFGSFYSVNPRNRRNIARLAMAAARAGAWVCYDPNFRKPHIGTLEESMPFIIENIRIADITRGSDEDFRLIAGAMDASRAWEFTRKHGCSHLIYTRNREGVDVFSKGILKHFDVPQVEVVSTIGAGDSFNSGFVTRLHGMVKNELSATFWDEAIGRAVIFASEVCRSRDNFINRPGDDPAKV
ncbi:MAG: PfkB family carbohydrate kinase [Bacteroidota bacterium]